MAGSGAPAVDTYSAHGWRVPVVAASWHTPVMDGLIAGAMRVLAEAGATAPLIRVPGCFELPVAVNHVMKIGTPAGSTDRFFAGVVALGVVIRGGTPHFDYICQGVTAGLTEVALRHGPPVGFGVLTCENEAQALARAGLPGSQEDKGAEAAAAVLATAAALLAYEEGRQP
jgi:6,7-dimethyl-8-ribityllumazine synthase